MTLKEATTTFVIALDVAGLTLMVTGVFNPEYLDLNSQYGECLFTIGRKKSATMENVQGLYAFQIKVPDDAKVGMSRIRYRGSLMRGSKVLCNQQVSLTRALLSTSEWKLRVQILQEKRVPTLGTREQPANQKD